MRGFGSTHEHCPHGVDVTLGDQIAPKECPASVSWTTAAATMVTPGTSQPKGAHPPKASGIALSPSIVPADSQLLRSNLVFSGKFGVPAMFCYYGK